MGSGYRKVASEHLVLRGDELVYQHNGRRRATSRKQPSRAARKAARKASRASRRRNRR